MDEDEGGGQPIGVWTAQRKSNEDRTRALLSGASWSGNERNHIFFGGLPGHQFADISGVSGVDDRADSRSFALMDYDRDGWLDIALVNRNTPRVRLFRNRMGEEPFSLTNAFVAFRFVGGNREPLPSSEWSARDGLGTSVELELGDNQTLYREHQPESSIKAQNSPTMLVGIGRNDEVRKVTVRWLSGKVYQTSQIAAGTLLTVYEDASASPTGEHFVREPYRVDKTRMTGVPNPKSWRLGLFPEVPSPNRLKLTHESDRAKLVLYTTMATWCVKCLEEMPEFQHLREVFDETELSIVGVPIDPGDTNGMLDNWSESYKPPYELLIGLPLADVDKVNAIVVSELRIDAPPAAIVTDASGRVLQARWGVPTVSDLKKFLWRNGSP